MPWVLVVAIVGAAAYAIGAARAPAEHITIAPTPPPLDQEGPSADEPGATEPESQETLVGIVREHTDVSQYTYLRLDTDAGETWAAVYRAPVKNGATVTVEHASPIHSFHSREMNRDFDTIWFGMLPGYETAPTASGSATSPAKPAASSATPAGALSIADLAKQASALEGKQVTVAGKVVKENDGIMARNWIHLQDGTGSAANKTNDVLVTTDATAKVGDELVATGTVRTKQDFGSGYAYDFMIEQATVHPAPPR